MYWSASSAHRCGTWQFSLHNGEPCGFGIFLCISVAKFVTGHGVHVITMKHHIRIGSGKDKWAANCMLLWLLEAEKLSTASESPCDISE